MNETQFKEELKIIDEYFSNTPQEEIEKKLEEMLKEDYDEEFEKIFFDKNLFIEEEN